MNDDIKVLIKQYKFINGHLHYLNEQLKDNDLQLTAMGSSNPTINSDLRAKNKPDYRIETLTTRHDELIERINNLHNKQQALKNKLYNFIDLNINDPLSSQVFELHIIDDLNYSQIADKLGYTTGYMKRKYLECLK